MLRKEKTWDSGKSLNLIIRKTSVKIPSPQQIRCATLGKSLNFSE